MTLQQNDTDHNWEDDRDVSATSPYPSGAVTFDVGHDIDEGWFLDVPQNLDGKLLDSIFNMIEKQFGLIEIDPDDNDAILMENGNLRIWLQPMEGNTFEYGDAS